MGGMTIDVRKDGAYTIDHLAAITDQSPEDVLSDALRVYLWVLHEQFLNRKVGSINGRPRQLEPLIKDRIAAEKYFKEIGWEDKGVRAK